MCPAFLRRGHEAVRCREATEGHVWQSLLRHDPLALRALPLLHRGEFFMACLSDSHLNQRKLMQSNPPASFNELLGLQLLGAENGGYRLELAIAPHHLNGVGGVHGGVYLTLLDTVMARACRVGEHEAEYWPTLELKTNFLRSIGSGRIIALGEVVRRGRRTCYVEGELRSEAGELLARGSATLLLAGNAEPART